MFSNLHFRGVTSEYIKEVTEETYAAFSVLHDVELIVRRRPLKHTTMQAQPVVDWRFFSRSRRRFRIDICDKTRVNKKLDVRTLPREVLQGWIAHEMGHVVDYLARNGLDLIHFGLAYVTSQHFRVGAERMADLYAIEYGFGHAVMATKKFILEESGLPEDYLSRIERYYMSPEELELIIDGHAEERVIMDQPEWPHLR